MESENRKRHLNGVMDGRSKKAREDDGEKTATEAEVEEFYTILRRLHVAVRYFRKDNGDGRKVTEKGSIWKPTFEWKDFEEVNGIKNREKKDEGVEENVVFDLNEAPIPEINTA